MPPAATLVWCSMRGFLLRFIVLTVGLSLGSVAHAATAYPFDYKTMFLVTAKLNPLFDADSALDDFMHLFRPTVWNTFHTNEFVFKQKEDETRPIMKSMIDGYDMKSPIVLQTIFNLGTYDFQKHQFPIPDLTPNTAFSVSQNCCQDIPRGIRYFMSNWPDVVGVPVSEAAAKAFVERHRPPPGLSRNLQVAAEVYTLPIKVSGEDEVIGRVQKIIFKDVGAGGQSLGELTFSDGDN